MTPGPAGISGKTAAPAEADGDAEDQRAAGILRPPFVMRQARQALEKALENDPPWNGERGDHPGAGTGFWTGRLRDAAAKAKAKADGAPG